MTQGDLFAAAPETPALAANEAAFSMDGVYRWWLTRELGGERPLVSCGLNPSTATAEEDDATIYKETKFARSWGCGRYIKVNAYSFRTRHPTIMFDAARKGTNIVGLSNDIWINRAIDLVLAHDGIFLASWGKHAKHERVRQLLALLERLPVVYCVKENLDGSPIHPLYQPDASQPTPWSRRVADRRMKGPRA